MDFPKTIIPNNILLKQICSVCSKYLSVGPVMMDAGRSICGRCTVNYDNKEFLKKSMYNKLAEKMIFKCINHFRGCNAVVRFNEMSQHESECNKNEEFSCHECSFECGTGCELIVHYRNKHPQNVIENNKINIQLNEKEECYIFWHLDTIISVKLTITQALLKFKLSPWLSEVERESSICYLHLSNGSKFKYVTGPIKMSEEISVDLENLTSVLNHKGILLIELNINTEKVTEELFSEVLIREKLCYLKDQEIKMKDGIITKKSNESLRKCDTLNDVLKLAARLLYCTTCHKYDYQNEMQIYSNRNICITCKLKQPSGEPSGSLLNDLFPTELPCEWEGCKEKHHIQGYFLHKQICPFREYKCPDWSCKFSVKMELPQTIIPNDILLKQICSVCSKYLSVRPIMMDAGKSICGRCTENYDNKEFLKQSMYNNMLAENLMFNCINHFQGCSALVGFNEMFQHESECSKNKEFSCCECSFEYGTGCELIVHYRHEHPQNVRIIKTISN